MPPPASVFHQPQVRVTAVPAWSLVPSPRNYNASIVDFGGKRWMAYRSHRMDQHGRCGIVVCELDAKWQATRNTWLNLPEQVALQMLHHEDPRLFVLNGRLHVSFTETTFHGGTQPYTCVMKYARLKNGASGSGTAWAIDRVFQPRYGRNDGSHQEKNWIFFAPDYKKRALYVIYQAEPHTLLELGADGETVVQVHTGPRGGVKWPWGVIRGGTPPVRFDADHYLTVFHSSMPYPQPPHWRRYFAGAYVFEAKPPFRITQISQRPILVGSEHDGHAHDPRNIESWKPFVVFPAGIMTHAAGWHVSYGVNDYMTVVVDHRELWLGDPTFEKWGPRFYRTENGNTPLKLAMREDQPPHYIRWERSREPVRAGICPGLLQVHDPFVAAHLQEEAADVVEITAEQYHATKAPR